MTVVGDIIIYLLNSWLYYKYIYWPGYYKIKSALQNVSDFYCKAHFMLKAGLPEALNIDINKDKAKYNEICYYDSETPILAMWAQFLISSGAYHDK